MQNKTADSRWNRTWKFVWWMLLFFNASFLISNRCFSRQQVMHSTPCYSVIQKDTVELPYTEQQLELFLDSIGALPTDSLMEEVAYYFDSVFCNKSIEPVILADTDLVRLKATLSANDPWDQRLDLNLLKRMTPNLELDSTDFEWGSVPVTWYSFDSRATDFHEYAICIKPYASWDCTVLFVQDSCIIAEHHIEHHYGLELDHFKNKKGKNVIYYKECFGTGTGIWQFNTFFYRFEQGQLVPVLNLLENGNLQKPWGYRVFWLESEIVKKRPLKIRMNFYQELEDSSGLPLRLIDGKTTLTYTMDEDRLIYRPTKENQDLTPAQLLTYCLADNEILFIHAYHYALKKAMDDPKKRGAVLDYLSKIKQAELSINLEE